VKSVNKNLPLQNIPYSSELTTSIGGYKRPIINWYPGHIAKAETLLSETLKSVDIVLEVRDSRAPKSTAHPRVAEWCGGKPRIVICTKTDLIPKRNVGLWKKWTETHGGFTWGENEAEFVNLQVRNKAMQVWRERQKYSKTDDLQSKISQTATQKRNDDIPTRVEDVLFVDAKRGQGIHSIHRAIHKAGQHVNERRSRRGLSERALRVGVIGYPNVGKSALINRILGRRRARSSDTPGVTRSLQWIRVRSTTSVSSSSSRSKKKDFELLDSPGIIPANMFHQQSDAMILAACNSIGTGAYDNQAVAAYLMEWIKTLHLMEKNDLCAPIFRGKCMERYRFDPLMPIDIENNLFDDDEDATTKEQRLMTGEDMLYKVADNTCQGDPENAARKILQDFRSGRLGPIALQFAPTGTEDEEEQDYDVEKNMNRGVIDYSAVLGSTGAKKESSSDGISEEKIQIAVDLVKEKGLDLPPVFLEEDRNDKGEVGKGLFDGW